MPDVRPAFEARLLDGSWLRVFASGRIEGVQHDLVINRIPAMINQALAQEMMNADDEGLCQSQLGFTAAIVPQVGERFLIDGKPHARISDPHPASDDGDDNAKQNRVAGTADADSATATSGYADPLGSFRPS
jgi:hypothetical protein